MNPHEAYSQQFYLCGELQFMKSYIALLTTMVLTAQETMLEMGYFRVKDSLQDLVTDPHTFIC